MIVDEKGDELPRGHQVHQGNGKAEKPHHFDACPEALPNPPPQACPQVLGGVVGNAVSQGGKGGGDQVIQLDCSRISRRDAYAAAVDHALDHDVANGDEALLQNAGDGDGRNASQ